MPHDVARLQASEQPVECVAGNRRVDAAKRIIGAELDDDEHGAIGNRPVEPGGTGGGGVARHAGIGDLCIDAFLDQGRFEAGGEIFTLCQAKAGGEAVTEGDDLQRRGARRKRGGEEEGEDEGREQGHGW